MTTQTMPPLPRPGARRQVIRMGLPGLAGVVEFADARPVAAALRGILNGWPLALSRRGPAAPAIATVTGRAAGFHVRSPFLERALRNLPLASAVNAVAADLLEAWCVAHPDHVCLHAGGAILGGRAVAFLGGPRAGKSTLLARLTLATGVRVLADDVLPVSPTGAAMGLGLPPRLRLPLPGAASPAFRAHVAAVAGPGDGRYAYLAAATVAPHGTRAPLAAVVLLDRRPGAGAALHELAEAEALHELAARRILPAPAEAGRLDRIAAVAGRVRPLRLVYDDLEAAAALVVGAFGAAGGEVAIGPPLPVAAAAVAAADALVPPDPGRRWRRGGAVAIRRRGGEAFLWSAEAGGLVGLNHTARAVWDLLARPATGAGIARVLADAFPDADGARIAADVGALLASFAAAGLIGPAGGPSPP
ncbi:MAG: PqqD family peptide modification chaperone [Rhodobacteraceae bacterium]|nr:PqqD family peptide modification chaperone [Paracoccaceae bacterium]